MTLRIIQHLFLFCFLFISYSNSASAAVYTLYVTENESGNKTFHVREGRYATLSQSSTTNIVNHIEIEHINRPNRNDSNDLNNHLTTMFRTCKLSGDLSCRSDQLVIRSILENDICKCKLGTLHMNLVNSKIETAMQFDGYQLDDNISAQVLANAVRDNLRKEYLAVTSSIFSHSYLSEDIDSFVKTKLDAIYEEYLALFEPLFN